MHPSDRPPKTRARYVVRLGLIVLVAAAILSFAAFETGAVSRVPGLRLLWAPRAVSLGVPAPAGSKLLRSYEASFNGCKSLFGHYSSPRPPDEVIEHYKAVASRPPRKLIAGLPGVQSRGRECAMLGYRDADGSTVGVVAFEEPRGGSSYFVGRTPPARLRPGGPDVPGREPPDVPKPLRSKRVMCLENLAGLPSLLSLYEGWGETLDTIELIRRSLSHAGWRRNTDVEHVAGSKMPGTLLSYTRGVENCLIHIEREARTHRVATTMFYCQKPWLPPGRGF